MTKKLNAASSRFLGIFFLLTFMKLPSVAQSDTVTRNHLLVIREMKTFRQSICGDSGLQMTDLKKLIPTLRFDLRYSTSNNFLHKKLYPPLTTSYMRKYAVMRLKKIQQYLFAYDLGLKIFDAYRPWSVTKKMWDAVRDERYAADPSSGSGHNRGIAVDLTIVDLKSGEEIPMGTGFDNFTDSAHQDFMWLPLQVRANRLLLKTIMEENGFVALSSEWWHFSLPDPAKYPILDISFSSLLNEQGN
jgi:zinc D-Ala-D-Ala dipeptidase